MSTLPIHCCHACGLNFRQDCKSCCISDFTWFKDNDFSSRSLAPCDCEYHGKARYKEFDDSFNPKHQSLACNQQMSAATLPEMLDFRLDDKGSRRVVARLDLPARSLFGPFVAPLIPSVQQTTSKYQFAIVHALQSGEICKFDILTDSDEDCNWMKHVHLAPNQEGSNVIAFQFAHSIYFVVAEHISIGEELVVSYGRSYSKLLRNSQVSSPQKSTSSKQSTRILRSSLVAATRLPNCGPDSCSMSTSLSESDNLDVTIKRLFVNPPRQPRLSVKRSSASNRLRKKSRKQLENVVFHSALPDASNSDEVSSSNLMPIATGSQKSEATSRYFGLLDPSPAPLRAQLGLDMERMIEPIAFFPDDSVAPGAELSVSFPACVKEPPEMQQGNGPELMTPWEPMDYSPVDTKNEENITAGIACDGVESGLHGSPVVEETPSDNTTCAMNPTRSQPKRRRTIKPPVENGRKRRYSCRYCGMDLNALKCSEMREHYKIHLVDGKYPCSRGCAVSFDTLLKFHEHFLGMHDQRICEICGHKAPSKYELGRHAKTHKEVSHPCGQCGEILTSARGLRAHVKRLHTDEPIRRRAAHQGPLRRNVQRDKWDTHFFKCTECQEGFLYRKRFTEHLDHRHPDWQKSSIPELNLPMRTLTTYGCGVRGCGRFYPSQSEAEEHLKKHSEAQVLKAQHKKSQGKPSQQSLIFGGAIVKGVRELYYCHYCDRSFEGPRHLLHHCKSAHPEYHDVLMPHAPKGINWLVLYGKGKKKDLPNEDESG